MPVLLRELRSVVLRLLAGALGIWAVLVLLGLSVRALDERIWPLTVEENALRWLAAHRTPGWNEAAYWMSWITDTIRVEISLAVVAVVFRLLFGRWRESVFVVTTVIVQVLAFVLATAVVDRGRPDTIMASLPPTSSFPSGHVGSGLALYLSIALALTGHTWLVWRRVLIWAMLIIPPLCVGFSRLYVGAHFPSDLVGSVVSAGLSIALVARLVLSAELPPRLHDVLDTRRARRP